MVILARVPQNQLVSSSLIANCIPSAQNYLDGLLTQQVLPGSLKAGKRDDGYYHAPQLKECQYPSGLCRALTQSGTMLSRLVSRFDGCTLRWLRRRLAGAMGLTTARAASRSFMVAEGGFTN